MSGYRGKDSLNPDALTDYNLFLAHCKRLGVVGQVLQLLCETKLQFLLVRQDHNDLLAALRRAGLDNVQIWRLKKGEPIKLSERGPEQPDLRRELINYPRRGQR